MTRLELMHLLISQARSNGFAYRRWYSGWLGQPWASTSQATEHLCQGRQYYALLFSHDFAQSFWKSGEQMTLQVPTQQFQRRMSDGTVGTVTRKGFTRRLTRPDVWRYHLKQMADAQDPLRYIRRFLRVEEELEPEPDNEATDIPGATDPRFIIDEEDLLDDDDA